MIDLRPLAKRLRGISMHDCNRRKDYSLCGQKFVNRASAYLARASEAK